MKSIEDCTDQELLEIIRKGVNSNIPGSECYRANTEWQIRHQQKILEETKNNNSGIYLRVGGDMINHGVIQTDANATVDIAVAGNYSSNDNTKIIKGELKKEVKWYREWLKNILLGIIIAGVVYYLGWN